MLETCRQQKMCILRIQWVFVIFFAATNATTIKNMTISVPVKEVLYKDQYICHAVSLQDIKEGYLSNILVEVEKEFVHHVSLSICESPVSEKILWNCAEDQGQTCTGSAVNFMGYVSNTKDIGRVNLPKETVVKFGRITKLKTLVTQVHFRNREVFTKPVVNVTLSYTEQGTQALHYQTYSHVSKGYIPAKSDHGFFAEVACRWQKPNVTAYRYSTHTHSYGVMIEGYLIRNDRWYLLGSELARHRIKDWTEIPGGPLQIQPGDIIASRCLYINPKDTPVRFGLTDEEEMCNFELAFGYEVQDDDEFQRGLACNAKSPKYSFCKIKALASVCNNY